MLNQLSDNDLFGNSPVIWFLYGSPDHDRMAFTASFPRTIIQKPPNRSRYRYALRLKSSLGYAPVHKWFVITIGRKSNLVSKFGKTLYVNLCSLVLIAVFVLPVGCLIEVTHMNLPSLTSIILVADTHESPAD
jgi:hypothetical protein